MAKALKKAAPRPEVEYFDEVEQGSEEWHELRRGIPTTSQFGVVMAEGKDGGESVTRRDYLYRLAGERLTGLVAEETFRSKAMDRGREMEAEARQAYAQRTFAEMRRVGFVRRTISNPLGQDLVVGCSPDSLVGEDGALEIKTMRPDLMIALAEKGAAGFPTNHRAQVQGTMWVCGLKWVCLKIFYRRMPISPEFVVLRDQAYIDRLKNAVEEFEYGVRQLVEKIKRMGGS